MLVIFLRRDYVFLIKIDLYGNFNWIRNGGGMILGELGEVFIFIFVNVLFIDGDSIIFFIGYF